MLRLATSDIIEVMMGFAGGMEDSEGLMMVDEGGMLLLGGMKQCREV